MVGLGRMGANIVRRLQRHDITSVVYDVSPESVKVLAAEGSIGRAISQISPPNSQLPAPSG